MKKIFALTLVLALLATPAFAVLRDLDAELGAELKELAREHLAAELNVDIDEVVVDEAWVREFWNIEKEVYVVILQADGEAYTLWVNVDTKEVLDEEGLAAIEAADIEKAGDDPVFGIMVVGADEPAEGEAGITSVDDEKNSLVVPIAAGVVVLAGAGIFVAKRRQVA